MENMLNDIMRIQSEKSRLWDTIQEKKIGSNVGMRRSVYFFRLKRVNHSN